MQFYHSRSINWTSIPISEVASERVNKCLHVLPRGGDRHTDRRTGSCMEVAKARQITPTHHDKLDTNQLSTISYRFTWPGESTSLHALLLRESRQAAAWRRPRRVRRPGLVGQQGGRSTQLSGRPGTRNTATSRDFLPPPLHLSAPGRKRKRALLFLSSSFPVCILRAAS